MAAAAPAHTPARRHIVALDCEMIGIGHHSYLARVTIVDEGCRPLLDAFVTPPVIRSPHLSIDYRTHVSGVTKEILDARGQPYHTVMGAVRRILNRKNTVILGHALTNDFNALQIPDWRTRYVYYDTTEIPFFMKANDKGRLQPQSLKKLAAQFLGESIQVEGRPHDSVEDACTVVKLYRAHGDKFTPAGPAPADPAPASPAAANVRSTARNNRARRRTQKQRRRT